MPRHDDDSKGREIINRFGDVEDHQVSCEKLSAFQDTLGISNYKLVPLYMTALVSAIENIAIDDMTGAQIIATSVLTTLAKRFQSKLL